MRIIAGVHGSRRLKTLDGDNTRPTQDKIKEAIFSKVGPYFDGGKALDLFGGSGAVGLECISRGMNEVVIADNNQKAIRVIKENINLLKENDKVKLERSDYKQVLEKYKNAKFDFIFIDPPYALKEHENIIKYIDKNDMLNDGYLVVETASEDDLLENIGNLIKDKEKKYGITKVHYYKRG